MVKNPPASTRDLDSISELERSPGEGNGNILSYSCLGNLMDRGTRQPRVHRVAKELNMMLRLNSKIVFLWLDKSFILAINNNPLSVCTAIYLFKY